MSENTMQQAVVQKAQRLLMFEAPSGPPHAGRDAVQILPSRAWPLSNWQSALRGRWPDAGTAGTHCEEDSLAMRGCLYPVQRSTPRLTQAASCGNLLSCTCPLPAAARAALAKRHIRNAAIQLGRGQSQMRCPFLIEPTLSLKTG
mmetsp:Transcript_115107/g.221825  ORF Transcript_115107/g.221825 Transcript_115107/m.221825 type:complete len:145 (-) Transcript_115107:3-437(-)